MATNGAASQRGLELHVYVDRGEIVGGVSKNPRYPFRYVNGEYEQMGQADLPLFRVDDLRRRLDLQEPVFVLDSEDDVIALDTALRSANRAGAVTTIAPGLTERLAPKELSCLAKLGSGELTVVFYGDAAARKIAEKRAEQIAGAFMGATIHIVTCNLREYLKDHTAQQFEELVCAAKPLPILDRANPGIANASSNGAAGASHTEASDFATRASSVKHVDVRYLWHGRLAFGMVTLMCGVDGSGKTSTIADIAARLSRGQRLPGNTGEPLRGESLIISSEEAASQTMGRLKQVGADLDRVYIREFLSFSGLADVNEFLERHPLVKFLSIDPLAMLIDSKIENSDAGVRERLTPLLAITRERDVATNVVRHMTKERSGHPRDHILGSAAFKAVPRFILFVDQHARTKRRGLFSLKAWGMPVAPIEFATTDDGVKWIGEDETLDAQEFWLSPTIIAPEPRKSVAGVEEIAWLRKLLEWPMAATDVVRHVEKAGFSMRTIARHKVDAGARSEKIPKSMSGQWYWYLEEQVGENEILVGAPAHVVSQTLAIFEEVGNLQTDQPTGAVSKNAKLIPEDCHDELEEKPVVTKDCQRTLKHFIRTRARAENFATAKINRRPKIAKSPAPVS